MTEGVTDMYGNENNYDGGGDAENDEPNFSDDDDEEVDVGAVIRDFGGHDLMQGIQNQLHDQLKRQHERVVLEKKELENELVKISKRKEHAGVELYSNQQQLARMQMALENLHNQYHSIAEARIAEEAVLDECKQRHAALKSTYAEKQKTLLKAQAELDTLTQTMTQVEKYNTEMKSEIAITRRATYKAETSVQELEKAKHGQDLYIDNLNQNIKVLRADAEMYRHQLEAQAKQTEEAKQILKETAGEMDLITFEKKQLLVQWKASVVSLTKRDEAVAAAQAQVDRAKRDIADLASELLGIKREIVVASTVNVDAIARKERLAKELGGLEEHVARLRGERDLVAARYQMLQKSLAQTHGEEDNAASIREELEKKIDALRENIGVVARERQAVELEIFNTQNEKITVAKAVKNFGKSMAEVKSKMHGIEAEVAAVDNERSRIKVDALNTQAHNVQLGDMLDKAVGELSDKDKLIEKYQLEIRQRNDEIEKKMLKVDGLNRKYSKLVEAHKNAGGGDGPLLGPLEATIKSLNKEIDDLAEESLRLQQEWLRDQTALVDTQAETEALLEGNTAWRAKESILTEKRLRTLKHSAVVEAEIRRLEGDAGSMQTDLKRLNELIGTNSALHEELVEQNKAYEREFVAELKELEVKSVASEKKLAAVVEAKDENLDEIMEAERQLLLWEKKIQLEKETQAALDPEVGMGEVKAMEKEIHRMGLRLSTLKVEKERLVKELERALHKREALSVKHRATAKSGGSSSSQNKPPNRAGKAHLKTAAAATSLGSAGGGMTRAELTKKLAGLKKAVRATAQSGAEYHAAIEERKENLDAMTAQLEQQSAKYGALEERANDLQNTINAQLYEKQRMAEVAAKRHRTLKRYQGLERGTRVPVTESDDALIEARLDEEEAKLRGVRGVVGALRERFDHLDEVLGRVLELAADE